MFLELWIGMNISTREARNHGLIVEMREEHYIQYTPKWRMKTIYKTYSLFTETKVTPRSRHRHLTNKIDLVLSA
jgi:hypothetical protein